MGPPGHRSLDQFTKVMGVDRDVGGDAAQPLPGLVEQGGAPHLDQGFGNTIREGPEPGSPTGGQRHSGQFGAGCLSAQLTCNSRL